MKKFRTQIEIAQSNLEYYQRQLVKYETIRDKLTARLAEAERIVKSLKEGIEETQEEIRLYNRAKELQ